MKKRSKEGKKEAPKKWFTGTKKIILCVIVIILIALAAYLVLNKEKFTKQAVKPGDTVYVNYVGRNNETVFDTNIETVAKAYNLYNPNRKYEPMGVMVGAGKTIKGFEDALYGMKTGEKKTVTIPPELAYGVWNEKNVITAPKSGINNSEAIKVGISLTNAQGRVGKVTKVNETTILVDFNHPLAGKTLTFDITLMGIKK